MKILEYKYQIISVILASIVIYMYLHQHEHSHAHEEDHAHENESEMHDHEKTVKLNPAQYSNAEIDTGWFLQKNISDVINASGYTKLDPQDQASVASKVNGTVNKITVIEGDYVKRGQILARVSSIDYNNLLLERIRLMESIDAHTIQTDLLEKENSRQELLANENINAMKILEKVRAELDIEQKKAEAARNQLKLIDKNIQLIGNGGSNDVLIKSPISGYITEVDVIIGSQLKPGDAMFSIVDNSKMHVDLLVYEKDLAQVQIGQRVRFILTNQGNKEITGTIYNIGKSFASESKSVEVHADIEANGSELLPGMYVNALIDIGSNTVKSLPEEAIVFAEGRNFIFLWENENTAPLNSESISFTRLEVKKGASQLGFTEVIPLGAIHNGDRIVTKGSYYLQSHLQKSEGGGSHSH